MDENIVTGGNELIELSKLSREFGSEDYLKGGGGNSSVKDDASLWIKPSGTVLKDLGPDDFLPMDRVAIRQLYCAEAPVETAAREAMVKDMMMSAVHRGASGRPSVEAPLHETIDYRFVMHTHPVLVNGMTCAKNGEEVCRRLFPKALWFDKPEAGYMLCMNLRKELEAYKAIHGVQTEVIFLKNHGMFVSADEAERVRALHAEIMNMMRVEFRTQGVTAELILEGSASASEQSDEIAKIQNLMKGDAAYVSSSDPFAVADGPITPDHIVYSKSYPLLEPITEASLARFKSKHGYMPRVIKTARGVFGVGTDAKSASLALELAVDGAQVMQLAAAFGGLEFLSQETADFFDNWEVEAYRRSLMTA